MKRSSLNRQATAFADQLTQVLNGTVCTGIRLKPITDGDRHAWIGYRITQQQVVSRAFQLGVRKKSDIYLTLSYQLAMDDEGDYLTVKSSVMALSADSEGDKELLHIDYERAKPMYAEAHLQVAADSPHWEALLAGRKRALKRLHLPVGGRRYRPSLEDLIEFMIVEQLVQPNTKWEETIKEHRTNFHQQQLRAAIRRDPETAKKMLAELDAIESVSGKRHRKRRA